MSKDRPAGMDDKYKGNVQPPKVSMGTVAKVAGGRVDSGPKSSANLPRGAGREG